MNISIFIHAELYYVFSVRCTLIFMHVADGSVHTQGERESERERDEDK